MTTGFGKGDSVGDGTMTATARCSEEDVVNFDENDLITRRLIDASKDTGFDDITTTIARYSKAFDEEDIPSKCLIATMVVG